MWKRFFMLCLLVLLGSFSIYSDEEKWYRISETELTELETRLIERSNEIEKLNEILARQKESLERLTETLTKTESILDEKENGYKRIEKYLREYEKEASLKIEGLRMQRNVLIVGIALSFALGLVTAGVVF